MFDASHDQTHATADQMTSSGAMWQILAMDFDGFYGTRIVVAAADRQQAALRATREVERFARARLEEIGSAYGMSSTMRNLEEAIAKRRAVFHAEAIARIAPVATGATIISAPGWRA